MKNQLAEWSSVAFGTIEHFWQTIATNAPRVLGGIFLLVIGWVLARFLSRVVKKVFLSKRMLALTKSFDESSALSKVKLDLSLATILSKFVYWIVLILFLVIVSDNMGWGEVSQEIGALFGYLPRLLVAIIIFVIGMYIADVVRHLLKASLASLSFGGGVFISNAAYYIILVIVTVTALNQAGIDTDVITANLSIIIGAVLLAFAIGFGLASKDVIRKILFSYYSQQSFEVGQKIKHGAIEGTIVSINRMSVFVQTSSELEVVPVDLLMSDTTTILSSPSDEG